MLVFPNYAKPYATMSTICKGFRLFYSHCARDQRVLISFGDFFKGPLFSCRHLLSVRPLFSGFNRKEKNQRYLQGAIFRRRVDNCVVRMM